MSLRRLEAKAVLAGLFFLHLFKRVVFFWKPHRGLTTFLGNYQSDAIFPVTPNERALMPSFEKCQACSLCTFSCTAVQQGKAPASFEPKFLMLGYGRSGHEAEYYLEEWLPCLECGKCEVNCPNDVPIHEMAETIRTRRENLKFRKP